MARSRAVSAIQRIRSAVAEDNPWAASAIEQAEGERIFAEAALLPPKVPGGFAAICSLTTQVMSYDATRRAVVADESRIIRICDAVLKEAK